MNIISYRYTNSFKQIFLGSWILYFGLSLIAYSLMLIFGTDGNNDAVPGLIAVIVYQVLFLSLMIFLFISFKFFFTLYDDKTVTYCNRLTKKNKSVEISQIKRAVLSQKGVFLYGENQNKELLRIPMYRLGVIKAIEIDNFYKQLKGNENISVTKEFTILPGYGKLWTVIKVVYFFLAALTLLNCATPLAMVIVVVQNFVL